MSEKRSTLPTVRGRERRRRRYSVIRARAKYFPFATYRRQNVRFVRNSALQRENTKYEEEISTILLRILIRDSGETTREWEKYENHERHLLVASLPRYSRGRVFEFLGEEGDEGTKKRKEMSLNHRYYVSIYDLHE